MQRMMLHHDLSTKEAVDSALLLFGQHLVSKIGDEVDRIEADLKEIEPTLVHIDLESN